MAQFQLYISPILASLVANILATSIREGMFRVWYTRQASPSRTVLKNNTRSPSCNTSWGAGDSDGGGVVKVKEMVSLSAWCWGGMMEGR